MKESEFVTEERTTDFSPRYNYTQYSHDKEVNVIPKADYERLVRDTFKCITDTLRSTYGPYGSSVIICSDNRTTTTKDGYNTFSAMNFSNPYKRMVYLAISKIIDRVNDTVGDGTTSCILLAEKIFNKLNDHMLTAEDQRLTLDCLNSIQASLNVRHDDNIMPLTKNALTSLISVADNYDYNLTEKLYAALEPKFDEAGMLTSKRNVIVNSKINPTLNSTEYEIAYMPGKYRVKIDVNNEFGLLLNKPRKIKIALYDHMFNESDWNGFTHVYNVNTDNNDLVLIIARGFNASFMDHEYTKYLKMTMIQKKPVTVHLASLKGLDVQAEFKDLGALLNVPVINLDNTLDVDDSKFATTEVSVYKGNALVFYDVNPPEAYINNLKMDMERDLSNSLVKHKMYVDRIRALSLKSSDTLVTVVSPNSLENNLIVDKIEDCVSIVSSADLYGIVPNLFVYGYGVISDMADSEEDLFKSGIIDDIGSSITGLLKDIFVSKYRENVNSMNEHIEDKIDEVYEQTAQSFDIITEEFCNLEKLPTSAQYDLEVIASAISIVKYLLTANAFVFDFGGTSPNQDLASFQ